MSPAGPPPIITIFIYMLVAAGLDCHNGLEIHDSSPIIALAHHAVFAFLARPASPARRPIYRGTLHAEAGWVKPTTPLRYGLSSSSGLSGLSGQSHATEQTSQTE